MEKLLGSLDVDHTQYKFGQTKVDAHQQPGGPVVVEPPLMSSLLCLLPGVLQGRSAGSAGGHEGRAAVSDPHHRAGHVQREANAHGARQDDAAKVGVSLE